MQRVLCLFLGCLAVSLQATGEEAVPNCFPPHHQFPIQFDAEKLGQDLAKVFDEKDAWLEHYNKRDYQGGWEVMALRSMGGQQNNIFGFGRFPDLFLLTPLGQKTNYIVEEVLPEISKHCTALLAVRLMKLEPGAKILEHTDSNLSWQYGEARFHVPLMTNPDAEFVIGGKKVEDLSVGTLHYMDFDVAHSAENRGTTPRVHLVVDCYVNPNARKPWETEDSFCVMM